MSVNQVIFNRCQSNENLSKDTSKLVEEKIKTKNMSIKTLYQKLIQKVSFYKFLGNYQIWKM